MSTEPTTANTENPEIAESTEITSENHIDDSKLKLPEVSLKKIEVKVDENEDCLYEVRAKLFIFFKEEEYGGEVRSNFWKERGTGTAKLLKNKETQKVRFVMRQDKTGKVISNHHIDPNSPNVGSDRSWMFFANDFSEDELKQVQYAIRLKDKETADEFKKQYTEAQEINKK